MSIGSFVTYVSMLYHNYPLFRKEGKGKICNNKSPFASFFKRGEVVFLHSCISLERTQRLPRRREHGLRIQPQPDEGNDHRHHDDHLTEREVCECGLPLLLAVKHTLDDPERIDRCDDETERCNRCQNS